MVTLTFGAIIQVVVLASLCAHFTLGQLKATQQPLRVNSSNSETNSMGDTLLKSLSILKGLLDTLSKGGSDSRRHTFNQSYCPSQCKCNASFETWVYGIKTNDEVGSDIDCHLNSGSFDVFNELMLISSSIKTLANETRISRGLRLSCDNGAIILWDSTKLTNETSIYRIEVNGCRITSDDAIQFSHFRILQYLTLNQVVDFKNSNVSFEGLHELKNLTLSGNRMETMPSKCARSVLPKLSFLNVNNNFLTSIECHVIRNLPSLSELWVSGNRFSEIQPCWLEANLLRLEAENNVIANMDVFGIFKGSITMVNLARNVIKEFPQITTTVYMLNVSFNRLTALRKEHFRSMPRSGNPFMDIIKRAMLFYSLDFSHNHIAYIEPGTFDKVSVAMKFVDLSDNRLTRYEWEHAPTGLTSGFKLDVRNNRLLFPPFYNTGFVPPSRVIMFASGNPYTCNCESVKEMQRLPSVGFRRSAGQIGDFSLDFADAFDILRHTNLLYDLLSKEPSIAVYDVDFFRCGRPQLVKGTFVRDLNITEECNVVRNCPENCSCTTFEKVSMTVISCSNLTSLPEAAPEGRLEFHLSKNSINKIENRDYLTRVFNMDLSYNNISVIDEDAFQNMKQVQSVDLRGNGLTTLPLLLKQGTPRNLQKIFLGENKYNCSCENAWMKNWLKRNSNISAGLEDIVCDSPKKFRAIKVIEADINCREEYGFKFTQEVVVSICLCLLVLVLSIIIIIYRDLFRVLMYAHFNVRIFDHIEEETDATYDAFIAYSSLDGEWVRNKLMPLLENIRKPFKVCIHEREFLPGLSVADNVHRCMDLSRRNVMVVSQNFINSEWCRFEFQAAHAATMRNKSKRLLLIMLEDIRQADNLGDDIKSYLKTNTYLEAEERWFKPKLFYFMPSVKSCKV